MLILFVMALALQIGASERTQAHEAITPDELAEAWASGDAEWATQVMMAAFREVSEGPCAISPYAAELAYLTGVVGRSGYHFNMALVIDDQVGVLTETRRIVAQEMKSEPGERVSEDRLFLFSRYLDPEAELGECPDYVLPRLPEVSEGKGQTARIYVRAHWRSGALVDSLSELDLLDSYPPSEGPGLAQRLMGTKLYTPGDWSFRHFAFAPCSQTTVLGETYRVCREGFERNSTQLD